MWLKLTGWAFPNVHEPAPRPRYANAGFVADATWTFRWLDAEMNAPEPSMFTDVEDSGVTSMSSLPPRVFRLRVSTEPMSRAADDVPTSVAETRSIAGAIVTRSASVREP